MDLDVGLTKYQEESLNLLEENIKHYYVSEEVNAQDSQEKTALHHIIEKCDPKLTKNSILELSSHSHWCRIKVFFATNNKSPEKKF